MKIYNNEINDGLSDKLAVASIKLSGQVKNSNFDKTNIDLDSLIASLVSKADTNSVKDLIGIDQPDLALVVSILVSTGWNLNDDVFVANELWPARMTPIHKPMNDEHDETVILGHIVKSKAIDKSGNEITDLGDLSSFDIEVAGVLYKSLPKLKEKITKIIDKANSGEMFVSMECWFNDFAYAFSNKTTGATKVVARDESTSFLTKHLRVYGGTGEFQGFKIGRVLKNIVFGGQGFVENPANPESVIKLAASLNEEEKGGTENMNEHEQKLQEALAKIESKDAEIASLKSEVEKAQSMRAIWETKVAEVDQALKQFLAESKITQDKFDSEKASMQKSLDEAVQRAEKAEKELAEIRKAEVARDRFAKLSKVITIVDEKATMAELIGMTDETFNTVLKYSGINTKELKVENTETEDATASLDNAEANEDTENENLQPGDENIEIEMVQTAQATAQCLLGRSKKNEKN